MDEARRKSAAKVNTARGKNGIIHAMKPHAKTALVLALAIVGGIAAGLRCDASEWVENSLQTNPRGAAYTVKTYTEGSFYTMLDIPSPRGGFAAAQSDCCRQKNYMSLGIRQSARGERESVIFGPSGTQLRLYWAA